MRLFVYGDTHQYETPWRVDVDSRVIARCVASGRDSTESSGDRIITLASSGRGDLPYASWCALDVLVRAKKTRRIAINIFSTKVGKSFAPRAMLAIYPGLGYVLGPGQTGSAATKRSEFSVMASKWQSLRWLKT